MSWHADKRLLESYARGTVDAATAFSVEAHLAGCGACREGAAPLVDAGRLALVWEEVEEVLDDPRRAPVERLLVRLGVPEHVARVLAATPSLSGSWLLAVALALVFAVVAAHQGERGLVLFLAIAPLLPLAGVAVAYGPGVDPVHEIGLAAPLRSFRLLLIRAAAVLVSTTALAGLAALALPEVDARVAAWLLPALGLTVMSLALATSLPPLVASASLAITWLVAVAVAGAATHDRLAAFRPPAQVAFVVMTALAGLVIARRGEAFETGREI